ncbi:MAG: tripartite tricarboxylate transporter substrate binding protein [Burkholderiaceae bacterium]|nr:tripartite tricarboxylate transporter substrate binding protein [Burkholderiaceae bacterium]
MNDRRRLLASTIALGLLHAGELRAQSPSGPPLSFIVPQPAGNPTDGHARRLQPGVQRELGQAVLVENMPGAGGSLGVNKLLAAPAGTPMLLIASQTESILTPLSVKGARYTSENLRPVLLINRGPYVLVGRPDLPASNFGELLALARSRSGKPLSHGHIGNGSMIHLLGERLARKAGIPLTQVPYKGVPPVIQDLIGSQIDVAFVPQSSARDLIVNGRLKVFGTTSAVISDKLPAALPISKANAGLADFVHGTWSAVFVARTLREEDATRLNKVLTTVCQEAPFQAAIAATGSDPAPVMTLAELDRFFEGETRLYQSMAKEIGIQAE